MSSKSRTDLNKGRAETGRLGQTPTNNYDNSDKLDASELKLQLELNEQVCTLSIVKRCNRLTAKNDYYLYICSSGIQDIEKKSRRS
jgi:hypothetical protein